MNKRHQAAKQAAQGSGCSKISRAGENDRRAPYEPAPSVLALLQRVWSLREKLSTPERAIVWSFLRRLEGQHLTELQLATAKRIGARVGIGFDDPSFDDAPGTTAPTKAAQPWGPLPLRPPGR